VLQAERRISPSTDPAREPNANYDFFRGSEALKFSTDFHPPNPKKPLTDNNLGG